jgi:RNA polymerase sigma factor (TIGR02999 family)
MVTEEVRRLLADVRAGDARARDRLFEVLYDDLRRIARHQLRARATGTLGTTAMVHEAYLRLVRSEAGAWQDRAHFLAVAARAMRYVLVDDARQKLARKRGAGAQRVAIEDHHAVIEPGVLKVLELEEALRRLGEIDDRLARIVELRFFGDLSTRDAAEVLGIGERTVERDWRVARSILHRWLGGSEPVPEGGS